MRDSIVIAIDGPAASGKGTLSRKLAAHFDYAHLDTGKIYRALGYLVIEAGGNPDDERDALARIGELTPELMAHPDLTLDHVAGAASRVAVIPAVRAALLDFQRDFANNPPGGKKGAVLDGRDVGTVVCPDAVAKLFVEADVKIRAERRHKELRERGEDSIYQSVLDDLVARDARDRSRASAPLKAAEDAKILDSSALSPDEVLEAALQWVSEKANAKTGI